MQRSRAFNAAATGTVMQAPASGEKALPRLRRLVAWCAQGPRERFVALYGRLLRLDRTISATLALALIDRIVNGRDDGRRDAEACMERTVERMREGRLYTGSAPFGALVQQRSPLFYPYTRFPARCRRGAYDGRVRTASDIHIETPAAMDAWVADAVADPVVRSVILFGSRSIGTHRPDSDWDLALVTSDGEGPGDELLRRGFEFAERHGVVVLSEERMLADKDAYATLASEVALGVVLEGEVYETLGDEVMARRRVGETTAAARTAFAGLLEQTWKCLHQEIIDVAECRMVDYEYAPTSLGGNSADAAERVAKMVTLSLGFPFLATHDIHELADDLPPKWQAKLKKLNGQVRSLHMANYGKSRPATDGIKEVCDSTVSRLRLVMDVLDDLADMENPLDPFECGRLTKLMASPSAKQRLAHVRTLAHEIPALADAFNETHGKWTDRLHSDSVEHALRPNVGVDMER